MRILVTGGCGFIASNFIQYMVKHYPSYFFLNLDLLTHSGNSDNLKNIESYKNYRFANGNLSNLEFVAYLLNNHKIDTIINFAVESYVDRSITSSKDFINTNILGTQILLEAARMRKIKKFIQISTSEVYGYTENESNKQYFSEESSIMANNPYSASKAGADLIVLAYYKTYGIPAVITRSTRNFGPYQSPDKFISNAIINAVRNKPIPVYGDGLLIKDWIFVEDNCQAIDYVLQRGKSGEVYNIGANCEKLDTDVVNMILEKLGKPEILVSHIRDRREHDRKSSVDFTKIVAELGWKPNHTFEEALEKTIKWYIENTHWWEKFFDR